MTPPIPHPDDPPTRSRLLAIAAFFGLMSGLFILGIGGRMLMRLRTLTLEAAPKFTIAGTLAVLGAGIGWGALTGPALLLFEGTRERHPRAVGPLFGGRCSCWPLWTVGLGLGFGGRIVAPPGIIVFSAILFPTLFVLHGIATDMLFRRWRRQGLTEGSDNPLPSAS